MRLVNRTRLDGVELARVLNAVVPPGLEEDQLVVVFEPIAGPCARGLAWRRGTKFPGSVAQASIYVPVQPRFPQFPPACKNRSGVQGWTLQLRTLLESLIYVVAHELAHLRYGTAERLAHAWGMRMVRRYRRYPLPEPTRRV